MFSVALFYTFTLLFCFMPGLYVHAFPRPQHAALARRVASTNIQNVQDFLGAHNSVRALHNATALSWSPSLASKAERWANACQFRHTDGVLSDEPYGENIVAGTGDFGVTAAMATFVQDEGQYNPANPTFLHFTQVVWKATTELGCAVARCNGIFDPKLGRASLYVCLYNPVGNVIGQALENVQV